MIGHQHLKWNTKILLYCIVMMAVLQTGNQLVEATLKDHKNIVYTLPRPGVLKSDDCYTDVYAEDLTRDLDVMKELGVTTVVTLNPWNFGQSHAIFLSGLASRNMSLGITFGPDTNGIMRRSVETLRQDLVLNNVTLEFLFLDFPLNFDNADLFFQWVVQVRSWMYQDSLDSPLFVRFFPNVTNPKTVQVVLQQWDAGEFDAWVVEAYSPNMIITWSTSLMEGNSKNIFFFYGADSWNMINNTIDYTSQEQNLMPLVSTIMDPNATISNMSSYDTLSPSTILRDDHNRNRALSTAKLKWNQLYTIASKTPLDRIKSMEPNSKRNDLANPAPAPAPVSPTPHTTPGPTPTPTINSPNPPSPTINSPNPSSPTINSPNPSSPTPPSGSPAPTGNTGLHILSGAILTFGDVWYLADSPNDYQGGAYDVCPDTNPYLHTSCGGSDSNIKYGDIYYSVEHLGILKEYETVYYFRCLTPTPAAQSLQLVWNPSGNLNYLATDICILSISIPSSYVYYIWAGGAGVAIVLLLLGCCKAQCRCCCCKRYSDQDLPMMSKDKAI